jgi:hypothetical protein
MIFLPEGLVSGLKTVITKSRLVRTSKPSGEVGTTQGGVTEIQ